MEKPKHMYKHSHRYKHVTGTCTGEESYVRHPVCVGTGAAAHDLIHQCVVIFSCARAM